MAAARYSWSMQTRKAASVFPDPVGAAMSVSVPDAMRGQPSVCGSVGPSGNRASNHALTGGQKPASTGFSDVTWVPDITFSPSCEHVFLF
jgi:hypothetical protein